MAESIGSQSTNHHGIPHSHNNSPTLHQAVIHHHPMHHSNSLHTNLTHNNTSHPSANNHHRKTSHDNDEETIARKKKNADAQAAFRHRRQTYIKSLEVTVTELKSAVTEMEMIVKTTSQQLKIQNQQVDYLQSKLTGYETGELKPGAFEHHQHCKCCKFAPPDSNPRLPTSSNVALKPLSIPTGSALAINPASDPPTPAGPSTTTPTVTGHENMAREWLPRQAVPSMFQTDPSPRSGSHHHSAQDSTNDPPHSTTSLDYPRNILHHQHHSNSSMHNSPYPRSSCDLALFTSFGATDSPPMSNFYSSTDRNHGSSTQSAGHDSSAGGVEMGSHHNQLQPIVGHLYDRSPPLRQPNSLGTAYSPMGHPHSFDAHHSGTMSSPRMWTNNHQTNQHPYTETGSNLDGSPKPALYSTDSSVADVDSSGYRFHRAIGERSTMRPAEYPPSLELRPLPQGYPMITTLTSPRADSSPFGVVGPKNRPLNQAKRRCYDDKFGPNSDSQDFDEPSSSGKSAVKLNGLPAKVAHCEALCTEVNKVVSQVKEDVKAITAPKSSTAPSSAHQSVSPNATSSSFPSPQNAPYNNLKPQRARFHLLSSQLSPSTTALAASHPQTHDEQQQPEQDDRRYQSMMGS
ncbi:hypothetical protein Pst134EB_002406 [Puccinia striiformis f. sp. tritici]|nr:hypothetical protein Pst134EB_002406 [Puccinia striiformis f. sp. tritici]